MFFRKVIYLVCYSSIFSPFLFLLPCCFSLSLCSLASLFVFCLLLLFVFLAFSLSLCRCPFLLLGSQLFAVFFCLCFVLFQVFSPFLFLLPCCFSLSLWFLASHSAVVRPFSLVSSSLQFCFVPASFCPAASPCLYAP
mgnify:CR=1 FL=1